MPKYQKHYWVRATLIGKIVLSFGITPPLPLVWYYRYGQMTIFNGMPPSMVEWTVSALCQYIFGDLMSHFIMSKSLISMYMSLLVSDSDAGQTGYTSLLLSTLCNSIYLCSIIIRTILGTSNRIAARGPVVMYTSCHGTTIAMTNCTIVSQKCSFACYHGIWCHNNTNWHHNISTMTTCNRKYTWLPCFQQMLLKVQRNIILLVYTFFTM